jgi:hypothetical protein
MAENKRFPWKKLLWWLIPAVFAAVYALGLTLMCEAAGRVEMRTFWIFLPTEVGQMALKNTAVLTGVLILALYVLTTKLSVAVGLVSVPMLIFHIINAIKLTLRNEPFYPWDFTLAGEATNILSSVKLTFSDAMLWACWMVPKGGFLPELPVREGYRWCNVVTGEPFDITQPVLEDVHIQEFPQ